MKEFLKQAGYKHWDTQEDRIGKYWFVTDRYQKRVDREVAWLGTYLCECNEKLFVNIDVTNRKDLTESYTSWTIYLTHQSPVNSEWCDLKIYNITEEKMNEVDLKKFEKTLRNMWIVFNKEQ